MIGDTYDESTGELVQIEDSGAGSWVAKQDAAFLDVQVATAKRYPRSVQKFQSELESWCCLNRDAAIQCFFSMPRDGKQVVGPSIRIAELIQAAYGNLVVDSQVIEEAREYVLVQGTCRDLERNTASRAQVRRNIMTSAKGGQPARRYSASMIETTTMAASAIARRNAILQVVPKALWSPLYEKARKVAHGDAATFQERKAEIVKGLKTAGVETANIKHFLGGKDNKDISADELLLLEIKLRAIQANEIDAMRAFPDPEPETPEKGKAALKAAEALEGAAKPKQPIDDADKAFGLKGDE